MRLSTSWKKYLQYFIDIEAFDKQHKLVLSFTKASKLMEECTDNFKYKASLCCITVAPIMK